MITRPFGEKPWPLASTRITAASAPTDTPSWEAPKLTSFAYSLWMSIMRFCRAECDEVTDSEVVARAMGIELAPHSVGSLRASLAVSSSAFPQQRVKCPGQYVDSRLPDAQRSGSIQIPRAPRFSQPEYDGELRTQQVTPAPEHIPPMPSSPEVQSQNLRHVPSSIFLSPFTLKHVSPSPGSATAALSAHRSRERRKSTIRHPINAAARVSSVIPLSSRPGLQP
mmetsp:Transcript_29162/g.95145  ORF Transcript_29162/g.95145 Transcript_29162/m.95145 type:complete len:224 (+) Transcript_29162:2248-2919(+)